MWQHHSRSSTSRDTDGGVLDKVLPIMSIVTMAMTLPQVWSVWVDEDTAGVSLLSWSAYLVAACLWLIDGLRKHDKTIWVTCIGWIAMDAAVVIGLLLRR
jgi:uncharacterized protein with PQ loop repeat